MFYAVERTYFHNIFRLGIDNVCNVYVVPAIYSTRLLRRYGWLIVACNMADLRICSFHAGISVVNKVKYSCNGHDIVQIYENFDIILTISQPKLQADRMS